MAWGTYCSSFHSGKPLSAWRALALCGSLQAVGTGAQPAAMGGMVPASCHKDCQARLSCLFNLNEQGTRLMLSHAVG